MLMRPIVAADSFAAYAPSQGSIYENQKAVKTRYSETYDER